MKHLDITDVAGARLSIDPEVVDCVMETEKGVFLVLSRPPIQVHGSAETLAGAIGAARKRACPVKKPQKKDNGKP